MPEERLQQQSRHRRCPEGEQHWCCETTSFFLKGGGEFGKEIVLICPILGRRVKCPEEKLPITCGQLFLAFYFQVMSNKCPSSFQVVQVIFLSPANLK